MALTLGRLPSKHILTPYIFHRRRNSHLGTATALPNNYLLLMIGDISCPRVYIACS